jgi:hypothetical protein
MTAQSGLQRAEQIQALLAQRRQVAADATKGRRSRFAAERARDLLLDFDHANIALRLVIVKRHNEAVQEGQYRLLVADQAVKQVARRTLFGPSFFAGRSLSGGSRGISVFDQRQELCLPVFHLQRMQHGATLLPCLVSRLFHREQQGFQFCRPLQALFFCQERQLAHQMHETEGMRTGIQEVRAPAIMDAGPPKPGQNADGIQGVFASLGVNRVVGELGRTGHMHPVAQAFDIQTRFILMEHVSFHQGLLDVVLDFFQVLGAALDQTRQRALADLDPDQISEHFTGSGPGQELLMHQIEGRGPKTHAVLDRCLHPRWEGGGGDLLAVGTLFALRLMLLHEQAGRWHIHHLSTFDGIGSNLSQILLAVLTAVDRMDDHLVRSWREHQGPAWVTLLSACFLATFLAQTLGLTHEPIRRWGQVTVVAVFRQSLLQPFHLLAQLGDLLLLPAAFSFQQGDLLLQPIDQLLLQADRFVLQVGLLSQQPLLLSKLGQFFFCHTLTLHGVGSFGKSLADLSSYKKSFLGYASAYKKAADKLVESFNDTSRLYDNDLTLPIVFLYRQYLELHLKSLVRDGNKAFGNPPNSPNHLIDKLWQELKPMLIKARLPETYNSAKIEAVEECIMEFAKVDENSENFRFPVHKKTGNPLLQNNTHLQGISYIDLQHLSQKMTAIGDFLFESDMLLFRYQNQADTNS